MLAFSFPTGLICIRSLPRPTGHIAGAALHGRDGPHPEPSPTRPRLLSGRSNVTALSVGHCIDDKVVHRAYRLFTGLAFGMAVAISQQTYHCPVGIRSCTVCTRYST